MATEAEDGDDYDLYHYDFTTASDWEIFIARLEEVIHQWKLHHKRKLPRLKRGQFAETVWQAQSEKLMFADVEFTMTRHFTKIESVDGAEDTASSGPVIDDDDDEPLTDMMRLEHDYIPVWSSGPYLTAEETQPHVIARWYGLREFVVLAPVQGSIMSESKLKVLLSSLCIAVNNTNCEVPMFVRALELWQKFYIGIYEGRGVRAKFEMIHLHRVPQQCKHLTGLLSLFKSKVGSGAPVEPVAVSARFMYTLQDWTHFEWSQHPPDLDLFHGEVGFEELGKLPFGAVSEPISSLILYTTWPDVMETVVVDSESYTDFEPTQAPLWSLSAKKDSGLSLLLTSYLEEFLNLCMNNKTNKDYLGDLTKDSSSGDYFEPFSQLMESRIPTLSDLLGQYTSPKRQAEGPISYQILMPILCYLFPDAEKTPVSIYRVLFCN
ncbi:hypothetical protein AAG570_001963 [Ranatra chinensis]|uniref:Rab3 GTPase-activating protein catalytic subunit n=1 Tax=Ranatra chinensis TaxID=642074 RepID=A0ABD0YWJ3_9HEMI